MKKGVVSLFRSYETIFLPFTLNMFMHIISVYIYVVVALEIKCVSNREVHGAYAGPIKRFHI